MNNRFWGAWKVGEANTNSEWLEKCLKDDFDFLLPFLGLSCAGFSLHAPLNPVSHRGTGQRVEWVVLGAKPSPYSFRCLLTWLLPCKYDSSTSPARWEGVYCCKAGLELLDVPFILLQPAGLMGQISVHVHAFCSLSSIPFHTVMAVGSETDLFIWCLCSLYCSSFLMPDCSSSVLSARHH